MRGILTAGLAVLLVASTANAQTVTTIDNAKSLGDGVLIEITGTIGNAVDFVNSITSVNFHVQDDTGGITIFGSNTEIDPFITPALGDMVTIQGTTESFNGLFEIDAEFNFVVVSQAAGAAPATTVVSMADLQDFTSTVERWESVLIRVQNVTFLDTGTFSESQNYTISGVGGTLTVRIGSTNVDLVGTTIPSGLTNVTGVLQQFDAGMPAPGVAGTGYQLNPRFIADIELTGSTTDPVPVGSHADAPFNGTTCMLTLTAEDVNVGETLDFVLNGGDVNTPLGGVLSTASVSVPP
ncbi:MAG: DUF5689 domain-containing protein, partial [Phycisphaerae bacterium]